MRLMMGTIPCLAVYTPVERCCFAGGIFSFWPSDWYGCMGVFLGIIVRETPLFFASGSFSESGCLV